MLYECPQCGGKKFIVPSAYIIYAVHDEQGQYQYETGEHTFLERYDDWECKNCGYQADESDFIAPTD